MCASIRTDGDIVFSSFSCPCLVFFSFLFFALSAYAASLCLLMMKMMMMMIVMMSCHSEFLFISMLNLCVCALCRRFALICSTRTRAIFERRCSTFRRRLLRLDNRLWLLACLPVCFNNSSQMRHCQLRLFVYIKLTTPTKKVKIQNKQNLKLLWLFNGPLQIMFQYRNDHNSVHN